MSVKTGSKFSKSVAAAVLVALGSASISTSANARASGPVTKQPASKEVNVGIGSGAIAGAFVAGPFGAVIGVMVGAIAGKHAEKVRATDKKAAALEAQLASTTQQLSDAQLALSAAADKSNNDPMLVQLAQQLRGDVLFRTGSAELDANALNKLGQLASVLAAYPDLSVEVDGFADPRGKAGENFELSQQRASAVRSALIVGGAAPDKIRLTAHGEQLSTAAKDDMEAYSWERRVSVAVMTSTPTQVAQAK